jgi:hypothetical protein
MRNRRTIFATEANEDGTFTVRYFGKVIGWVQRTSRSIQEFQALTIFGDVRRTKTLAGAEEFIISNYK